MALVGSIGGGLMYLFIPETTSFYRGFAGAFALQVVIYNIIRYFRNGAIMTRFRELEIEEIRQYDKQGMELQCAHCKHITYVPIRFDQDNDFTCPECDKSNAIYVNVTVARQTTNLDLKAISAKLIEDDKDSAEQTILYDNK